ncbi:MAG: hypothetical protein LUG46_05980 [Erysipelotrichaceae bacterium]|nr:hypothetical protein [Erysipelotrichaceae bacterium]
MKLTGDKYHQYIKDHIDSIQSQSMFEYDVLEHSKWTKGNDDTYVSIVLKDYDSHHLAELMLLSVCSLAALMEHYHVVPQYQYPNNLLYNNQQIGMIDIEELDEHTYIIDYYMHVNATNQMSLKIASKKRFKIKSPAVLVQTYFKVYYHFYETQDFHQVIENTNTLAYYQGNKEYLGSIHTFSKMDDNGYVSMDNESLSILDFK